MKLSIVSTLYGSADFIVPFHARVSAAARKLAGEDFELILVNDGSPDNSLDIAVDLTRRDRRVKVIDLSRNFGHHKAMMTGLAHSQGDRVFLLDVDLEEDPEWLTSFSQHMDREQADVVFGVQSGRKGSLLEKWSGSVFYYLFNHLANIELARDLVTARLMTRRYVEALISHQEREVFIAGLWYITGFKQVSHQVVKIDSGRTTYTFRRKLSILVNSVTSFSDKPLVWIFYLGCFISLFALLAIFTLTVRWAFFDRPLAGWTSVIASIWLVGGMVISFVGVIGMYLSKVFSETKRRPYTIIRHVYNDEQQ